MNEINETIKTVSDFLGKERLDELKDFVLEKLKENLMESIRRRYFVIPTDIEELMSDFIEKCYKEVIKKHKSEITKEIEDKLMKMIRKEEIVEGSVDGKENKT